MVYFLESKDEAFESFKHFKLWFESLTEHRILKLKSDRGGEYSSSAFLDFLKKEAIDVERGPANRPTSNGVAERYNRTILSKMRAQLFQSGLPLKFWAELAQYTCLQINHSPTVALDHDTPHDRMKTHLTSHLHPFSIQRLKPFGCLAYVHFKPDRKVQPPAKRMIFIGLEPGSKAFRLWDPSTRRVVISADVKFGELQFPAKQPSFFPSENEIGQTFPDSLFDMSILNFPIVPQTDEVTNIAPLTSSGVSIVPEIPQQSLSLPESVTEHDEPLTEPLTQAPPADDIVSPPPLQLEPLRSTRTHAQPQRYGFVICDTSADENNNPSYEQAMSGPDRELWRRAMEAEFESFQQHNVGTLVEQPNNANILGGMWVFSRPRDEHHRILKYKARWVLLYGF